MTLYKLTETCSVAAQIQPADVAALQQGGYATIVCNRPDNEDFAQPSASEIGEACAAHGVEFHHLPVASEGITMEMVQEFQRIVAGSAGPILAYCRSGQRSSVLWQYSGTP